MMRLTLRDDLPFVTVTATQGGATVELPDMLVDTGSASTLLSATVALQLGVVPSPSDPVRTLRGIGGREVVFCRRIDNFQIGDHAIDDFEVEIGGVDYGFAMNGILGMDFLIQVRAILNLRELSLDLG
jgi:predicted aspartyl protease